MDDAQYASRMAARHGMVGPADLWEMKRRFQIEFLKGVGLQPHHHLLDLGCGTMRGGIPLIQYLDVGHYTGVDVRPAVLEEGCREIEENGLVGRQLTPSPSLEPGLVRESSCLDRGWKGFSDEEATQCRADRGLAQAG